MNNSGSCEPLVWRVLLTCLAASENELYIFRQYTYILYIVSIVVCQKLQSNCQIVLKEQKQASFLSFLSVSSVKSELIYAYAYKYCYCFLPSLNMNQVPENYIFVSNQI